MIYHLNIKFTEPMLASSPADPAVYGQFIQARAREDAAEKGDEVETLPASERELTGWSVFHSDEKGLFVFDYKVRGFLKEAASSVSGKAELPAFKSKIDKWLFVQPRRIYLVDAAGQAIKEKHGVLERPLRAMTMQGPRVSVKRSDYVNAGSGFDCDLVVLPNGEKEIKEVLLRKWLDYGVWQGFGEWRNGSYGRFEYTLSNGTA
jgi:hypothetical protein